MAQSFTYQAQSTTSGAGSSRSLSTLRDIIRRNLGNDSEFYTDDDINREINRAQDYISQNTGRYKTSATQSTVIGTADYTAPTDCLRIIYVTYDNVSLDKTSLDEILRYYGTEYTPTLSTGNVVKWAEIDFRSIRLFRTPSEVKDLVIWYATYAPALSADGDVSIFPQSADEVMINRATKNLLLRDGETIRSPFYAKMEADALDILKRNISAKPQQRDIYGGGL